MFAIDNEVTDTASSVGDWQQMSTRGVNVKKHPRHKIWDSPSEGTGQNDAHPEHGMRGELPAILSVKRGKLRFTI